MVQLPNQIDCEGEVEKVERLPLPAGAYLCHVIEDEMKDTKKGDGKYIELKMEVLEGDHKGRWIFDRLNVVNPNKVAVEISERTLHKIGKACGLSKLTDTNEVRGIPMMVVVKIESSEKYGDKNEVVTYNKAEAVSSDGAPPWQGGNAEPPF